MEGFVLLFYILNVREPVPYFQGIPSLFLFFNSNKDQFVNRVDNRLKAPMTKDMFLRRRKLLNLQSDGQVP